LLKALNELKVPLLPKVLSELKALRKKALLLPLQVNLLIKMIRRKIGTIKRNNMNQIKTLKYLEN